MYFFVASFREFNVTLRFYQKIILKLRFSLILIDTTCFAVLICVCVCEEKIKLWSVLVVNGFILVSPFSTYFTLSLDNLMQFLLYLFFISLCKRNVKCKKYKNYVDFHCLSSYSKDSREMQREQILWGLQCLFWPARAYLIKCTADSQAPTHLTNASRLFDFISSTSTVLSADGRVHTVTCMRLYYLFPHKSFYTFSHLRVSSFVLPFNNNQERISYY